jgi:hypothetical protein
LDKVAKFAGQNSHLNLNPQFDRLIQMLAGCHSKLRAATGFLKREAETSQR